MDLRIFVEPQQGATYEQQLAMAQAAEAAGFLAFFRSDHYQAFSGDGLPGPTDAWITLAGIARETSTIRLGTMVTAMTFRLPGPLAISVAQVDAMSGGRVDLGIGAAWNDTEHRSYAIPFPDMKTRFEMLDEQLAVITGLWRTPVGETFDFDGAHYQVSDSPALPKPVQPGGPPIIIGGGGPTKTPRLAATYAAEFNLPFVQPDAFTEGCDRVRAACEAVGRDPESMIYSAAVTTFCGADEAEFERRCAALGTDPSVARQFLAGGTPDEVATRLRAYAEAGADRMYLQLLDLSDVEHVHLLGEAVAPLLS